MIITLNMDTEKDKEVCKKVLSLVLDFGGIIYRKEPKKRGRPRKEKA